MEELVVRYHNGFKEFSYWGASAAQVEQVLQKIQPELVKRCGNYRWGLDGWSGEYRIIATSKQGRFTESIGKTPRAALMGFRPARNILAEKYQITP